ncbi:hypothetical protein [Gimesia panareensis]|uniref:hypothetical protein n=1 Tax=Gimesia panareensis TaxID=2527978 RepID=UPI00118C646C|nr:hypothetical protein [Gimesia panareensis]QDU49598.1 hypothetical protein Pan110_19360 [Gimesia panareensis]
MEIVTEYDVFDNIRTRLSNSDSMSLAELKSQYKDWIQNHQLPEESIDSTNPPLSLLGDWMARKTGLTQEMDDKTWDRLPIDHWVVASKLTECDSDACTRFFELVNEYKQLRFHICSRVALFEGDVSGSTDELPLEAVVSQLQPEAGFYVFIVVSAPDVPSGSYRQFQFYSRDHDTVSKYIAKLQKTWSNSEG